MKREFLKPGMIILTRDLLIVRVCIDAYGELALHVTNPAKYEGLYENSMILPDIMNHHLVNDVYDERNIERYRWNPSIEDGKTPEEIEKIKAIDDIYDIYMIFKIPEIGSYSIATVEDVLKTTDLVWVSPLHYTDGLDQLTYNIIANANHGDVVKVYKDQGIDIKLVDINEDK